MSSFICSSKHFNSIEKSVIYLTQDQNFYFPYTIKESFPEFYNKRYYTQDRIDLKVRQTIDTLRELNVLCVSLQYKHHYEGVLDKEIQDQREIVLDRKESTTLNKVALFKALTCVNYQIEKEHLKELRELTQDEINAMFFLNELTDALAHQIVRDLPMYDKSAWEIN